MLMNLETSLMEMERQCWQLKLVVDKVLYLVED